MQAPALVKPRAKHLKVSFEEMLRIYLDWSRFDKTGAQTAVFKRQGWSRAAFFGEASSRGLDV